MEISKVIADDLWPLILSYDPNGPLKYASKKLFVLNIRFFRREYWATDISTNIELLKLRPKTDVVKIISEGNNRALGYAIIMLCDVAQLSGIITIICHMVKNGMFTDRFIHYAIKIVKDRYRDRGIVRVEGGRFFVANSSECNEADGTNANILRPAIGLIDEVVIIVGTFCLLYCIEHMPEALSEFMQNIAYICKSYYDDGTLHDLCKKMVASDIKGYMGKINGTNPGAIMETWHKRHNFTLPNYMEYLVASELPMIGPDDCYRKLAMAFKKRDTRSERTKCKGICKQHKMLKR